MARKHTANKTTTGIGPQVGHDEIAPLAKQFWEDEGRQAGRDLEYWLRAERELLAARTRADEAHRRPVAATGNGHNGPPSRQRA